MADDHSPQTPPIAQGAQDPLAPQDPLVPQDHPPPQNPQILPVPQAPHVPQAPQVPQQPVLHMSPLNWSHFKPKFSGKPDEDAKANLLGTNYWMDTHKFQDNKKVQRFCLILTGEARQWYELLRLVRIINTFRLQYSKICNTREQLFHAWRSFHFDKNMETMDAYMHCIR